MTKKNPLSIVVVGHTNAGKTSLLRTLTRDKRFGEVSHRNATTKHVEKTSVVIGGEKALTLFDTPGFEESMDLRKYLKQFDDGLSRRDVLRSFLDSPEANGRFEQEAKIVRLLLTKIDAVFYVIDTTEKPMPKHVSELDVLAMCARPVLSVLNCVRADNNFLDAWLSVLADRALHTKVTFDAVAPTAGSERLLYTRLATLLDENDNQLLTMANALEKEAENRRDSALLAIAELLIDVASLQIRVSEKALDKLLNATNQMHAVVKSAEQTCVSALLAIYRFDRSDLIDADLPVVGTKPDDNLFNPEVIKEASARLGIGAVIGAALGLGLDIALVGITMGAGAIVGGALGGMIVGSSKDVWEWAQAKYHGIVALSIDEPTLLVVLERQMQLLNVLMARTHAAQKPSTRSQDVRAHDCWKAVVGGMNKARAHPSWSRLGEAFSQDGRRLATVIQIQTLLRSIKLPSASAYPIIP